MTVKRDVILRSFAGGFGDGLALSDQDLCLHDVDAGDFLGHGMFDLNAGVHFDEVELTCFHIHQEFYSARTFVIHMFADLVA